MSMRSVLVRATVLMLALLLALPMALRGQEMSADFLKARQQFLAGDARLASQTVLMASVYVRQQVGRSKDETVGMKLLDAEGQLEKLSASLKAGGVSSVHTLDLTLTSIDRLLAQHHLQMVSIVVAKPRENDVPAAARDLDRAAFHFERSITLNGGRIAPEQATALADARAVSKEMSDTRAVPKTAAGVVAALERHVLGNAIVTAAMHE